MGIAQFYQPCPAGRVDDVSASHHAIHSSTLTHLGPINLVPETRGPDLRSRAALQMRRQLLLNSPMTPQSHAAFSAFVAGRTVHSSE